MRRWFLRYVGIKTFTFSRKKLGFLAHKRPNLAFLAHLVPWRTKKQCEEDALVVFPKRLLSPVRLLAQKGQIWSKIFIFGPCLPMLDQKNNANKVPRYFLSFMWVPKLLLSPVRIRIFCPKTTKFSPKLAFLVILGQAWPAHLVPCWWVGWWLWRAGCISQDTYLLYLFNNNNEVRVTSHMSELCPH